VRLGERSSRRRGWCGGGLEECNSSDSVTQGFTEDDIHAIEEVVDRGAEVEGAVKGRCPRLCCGEVKLEDNVEACGDIAVIMKEDLGEGVYCDSSGL